MKVTTNLNLGAFGFSCKTSSCQNYIAMFGPVLDKPSIFGDPNDNYKMEIVWRNVIIFVYLHCCALYSYTLPKTTTSSIVMAWVIGITAALGTTVGAHRLFTHRSYKANTKLRLLLLFMQTIAVQNSMYEWVRDHRVHHKYTDTNADPHNSRRGFFFSHIGWLMCKKHPDVKRFGARIEMSDLESDPLVMFQHKYYLPLSIIFGFAMPMWLACLVGESFRVVYYGHICRYMIGLHMVWMINSGAHLWGYRPYDKSISSTDSYWIGTFGMGEGWHNYHHVFPWDYKASELPTYWCNLSLAFLDFFAWLGWATDLKTVSDEMILKRVERTGDGTHAKSKSDKNNNFAEEKEPHCELWGWDDKEMTDADRKMVMGLFESTSKRVKDTNNNVEQEGSKGSSKSSNDAETDYKMEISWQNVFIFTYLHLAALYGFTFQKKTSSLIIGWAIGICQGLGTTIGAHRLYTHRTFKANLPLRILLMMMQTMATQNDMIEWVRDHRVHHKFTDTNADPHNSKRGFFFAHMGWLMCKKHPDVKKYGAKVDISDVEADPVLQFQRKFYIPLALLLNFVFPIWLACSFGEYFVVAWNGNIFRYVVGLHMVWCVNSVAHFWGDRPFDKNMSPTDSHVMGIVSLGEGWHNYHHCFPWDYKTSEFPTYTFNFSTMFIDFFAWIGWATDLKTVPEEMIFNRVMRTGDGTHKIMKSKNKIKTDFKEETRDVTHFWGFGDNEMTNEDMKKVKIIHEKSECSNKSMKFYADPPVSENAGMNYSVFDENSSVEKHKVIGKNVGNISMSMKITTNLLQIDSNDRISEVKNKNDSYKWDIKWRNVIIFIYLHYAAYHGFMLPKVRSTVIIGWIVGILSGLGTTVGSHRLFTHRTFKANQKLKALMIFLQTMAGQEPGLSWVRDHRVHHKFTDTNADPYNSRRGFFFSHIGWLMLKKHPDVIKQGKKIDMSDLESDPLLQFQAKNISPTDTYFVGFCALGEGWHNYHHIFPWDYKTAELPGYMFNISTAFIDLMAKIGWATELKTVPDNVIKTRVLRTGDGSHKYSKESKENLESNQNMKNLYKIMAKGTDVEDPVETTVMKTPDKDDLKDEEEVEKEYKIILKWRNIIVFIYLHIFSIYFFYDPPLLWSTYIIQGVLIVGIGFGTTVGSHRLFTHRTYRAKPFLRGALLFLQTMSGQEPVIRWVRDHRVHHKYTDTNADPHNSKRGFFFCHMGWLMCKKHPDVIKYGRRIDMSDLENDKMLQLQKKIYTPASFILTFVIPITIHYFLGEDPFRALNSNVFRYTFGLHMVWLVNSGAHKWGMRPYDKEMSASETFIVATMALGEGWHNYHHCFPWDYRTSETPLYWFNVSTMFIDAAAKLGLATDLKTVPTDMVKKRVLRTGDGSHKYAKIAQEDIEATEDNNNTNVRDTEHFWGWGDKEMTEDDLKNVEILHKVLD
ncbi:CLUMA_CG020908, isoform A [Clunio marinus]|uniref:CLUMA_CG020908, isoform A n=1 Tax=Clunio marinus TaxID=568069 RepID=A0A1J1J657_9DIPT|nr:CLUMA_CG020908, isoform A [Clunio marinus]